MTTPSPTSLPTRAMLAPAHTWDAHSIFPSDAAWAGEIARIEAALPDLEARRARLDASAVALADRAAGLYACVKAAVAIDRLEALVG